MTTFTTDAFDYSVESATFSAEASSLGLRPGQWPVQFTLASSRGTTRVFWRGQPDTDAEGLRAFGYGTLDGAFSAVIFND